MIAIVLSCEVIIWLTVLLAAAVLSFMYSGLEIGIYVMNKIRLDLRSEAGVKAAGRIRRIISDQRNFLAILLIGNNVANYAATFSISALFVIAGYGGRAEWLTIIFATPLMFIFCESLPKNVAHRLGENFVFRYEPLLTASNYLYNAIGLAPMIRGFSWLMMRLAGGGAKRYIPMGHEGITAIVAEGQATGLLTHLQTVMADRVMHINEVTLKDVMIPMAKVATAALRATREQMLDLIRAHNYSRFPILDADGHVTGILNIYEAATAPQDAAPCEAITEPLILGEKTTITDALYRMQRAHQSMAVVRDASGRHVGIVTVKDLVEEIVGELEAW